MDGRPSLRERQQRQTRAEIERAAFTLFLRHGYDATTVEEIAAEAGISPRTFFRYFAAKEDVVFGDHAATVARLEKMLSAAPSAAPLLDRVRQAVLAVQQPDEHPEREIARARLVAEAPALRARFGQLAEDLEDVVARFIATGFAESVNGEIRARLVAGAVFGALRGARRVAGELSGSDVDPQLLVELAFALIARGSDDFLPHPPP